MKGTPFSRLRTRATSWPGTPVPSGAISSISSRRMLPAIPHGRRPMVRTALLAATPSGRLRIQATSSSVRPTLSGTTGRSTSSRPMPPGTAFCGPGPTAGRVAVTATRSSKPPELRLRRRGDEHFFRGWRPGLSCQDRWQWEYRNSRGSGQGQGHRESGQPQWRLYRGRTCPGRLSRGTFGRNEQTHTDCEGEPVARTRRRYRCLRASRPSGTHPGHFQDFGRGVERLAQAVRRFGLLRLDRVAVSRIMA